jgi:AraC-like DNA-binding protein
MISHAYIPQPPLSDFVALLWFQEGYDSPCAKERALPEGTVELVINLREDALPIVDRHNPSLSHRARGSIICGPHSEFFVIDHSGQPTIMGVHFKPGGAFPFLGARADELHNTILSLDTLWGAAAGNLRARLLEARDLNAKFLALQAFLLERADRPLARYPAVAFALQQFQCAPHMRTISQVVEQVGLCERRFIQVFREEVGLTPKLFCRVRRFQSVLRLIERQQQVDWADVAATCGYFDQAHFIHDFRAFSGLNPTTYLAQRGERLNHVPLRD